MSDPHESDPAASAPQVPTPPQVPVPPQVPTPPKVPAASKVPAPIADRAEERGDGAPTTALDPASDPSGEGGSSPDTTSTATNGPIADVADESGRDTDPPAEAESGSAPEADAPAPLVEPAGAPSSASAADDANVPAAPSAPAGASAFSPGPIEIADDVDAARWPELAAGERARAAAPPSPGPAAPASLGVRLIGAVWLALFAAALVLLARRVFGLDFGAENPRVLWLIRVTSVAVPGYPALLGLLALLTGRSPQARLNPLALPFEPAWYSTLASMTWREVRRFFFHPVAYIVLFVFLFVNGILFGALLDYYAGPTAATSDFQQPASYYVTDNPYLWLSLIIICPALTMRLLAEEQRERTLEMLLTAPVSHIQVVLSKFLGTLGYFLCMAGVTFVYLVVIQQYAPEWDWGPVLGGYLGLGMVGALFLAIGVFTSSITQSQIIAYLLAALPLFGLVFLVGMAQSWAVDHPWAGAALRHVNVQDHQHDLANGIVHGKTVVFYVTSSVFFLFLAVRGVESHTWR